LDGHVIDEPALIAAQSPAASASPWETLLRERAASSPFGPSFLDHRSNQLSYQDLLVLFENLRQTLTSHGIGAGETPDLICVALPEAALSAVTMLVVADSAVCVPMNPNLAAPEYRRIFRLLSPRAVILQERLSGRIRDVCAEERLPVVDLRSRNLVDAQLVLSGPGESRKILADPPVIRRGLMLSTSGSTAIPKMVQLTHDNILAAASATVQAYELGPADRRLITMPLFHTQGLIGAVCATLLSRSSCTVLPYFDAEVVLGHLADDPITWYSGSSAMLTMLVEAAPRNYRRNPALRFVRAGGGPISEGLVDKVESLFRVPVVTSYGMTEANQIASSPLPPRKRRPGSVGIATGSVVAVEDNGRADRSPGVEGELLIKGPNLMPGYWADPEPERTFLDGWFRTGDLGRIDEQGYIWITGRLKDVINRGGEKISPAEIDATLLSHPDVVDCATFGVDDPVLGEDVYAAVVQREPGDVSPEQLRNHVRGLLTPSKVPRHVFVVEQIPRAPGGKLRRADVLAMCAHDIASLQSASPRSN
jgi:oxalate---CoA ligase